MTTTVAARQQASSWGFIFLNYHSSAAQKLHYYLVDQGLTLQALTSDSTLVRREKLLESANPRGIEIIDTASAWQSELKLSSHEAVRVCDAYDSDMLEKAIDYARLRLITWLVHRENFGQGISELQANIIVNNSLSNALVLLEAMQPCLIVSILAPCTPFDICIVALAQELGIATAALNETNLSGFYYLTFNQFDHGPDIAVFDRSDSKTSGRKAAAAEYLKNFIEETPYYINKGIQRIKSSLEQDQQDLKLFAARSMKEAKRLDTVNTKAHLRYTSAMLQQIGFASSRDLKHHANSQAQKERMRAGYIERMASNMVQIDDKPAVLILLDYYPEITRYPIGGQDYFYSNYFVLAKIIKESGLFHLCDTSQVYVKEHPAMLEVSNHSHPRTGLRGLMQAYGASFVSPLRKTTSLLLENPGLVVITGVSNAGVEASLLGCTTLTTSNPWWLCMPNTYHCSIYTRKISVFSNLWKDKDEYALNLGTSNQHVCEQAARAYTSFALKNCVNMKISMADIDTLFSSRIDDDCPEFSLIAKAIAARVAGKSY